MKPAKRRTLVTRVATADTSWLLARVRGQTLLSRQLHALVAAGYNEVVIFLPLDADILRDAIRQLAITLPIRLASVNLDPKFPFWPQLRRYRQHLPEHFILGELADLSLPFAASQLANWQAELVVAIQSERPSRPLGAARTQGRYVTALASQGKRSWSWLTGAYRLTRDFLAWLPAELTDEDEFIRLAGEFCGEHVVKACPFAADPDTTPPLPSATRAQREAQLLALAQRDFPEQSIIDPSATIAPTARLSGPCVIEAGVEIADFAVVHGPVFLGAGTRVGAFAYLDSVDIEAGGRLDPYTRLQNCYLPVGTHVYTTITTTIKYE